MLSFLNQYYILKLFEIQLYQCKIAAIHKDTIVIVLMVNSPNKLRLWKKMQNYQKKNLQQEKYG